MWSAGKPVGVDLRGGPLINLGRVFSFLEPSMCETDTTNYCHRCQERLISVRQAAEMLSISPKSVRNRLSAKAFPIPSYLFGGKRLFKLSEVFEFIRNLE